MRMVLLTAAAAAALVSALMAAQAQQGEQAPTIQPRAVQTETIRRPAQSSQPAGQVAGQPTTDSRGNETATTDRPTVQQPPATRRTARSPRQRAAERHRARTVQTRTVRTRRPVTTGQAPRASSVVLPARSGTPYAQATIVQRGAARPGDRIVLTEPQVTSLNAAFTDYIGRMNVWSRPPWDVPATVGATVPGWIQVYGVPAEIVAIYPDFAGEQFVVIGDDIVVIEPVTRRIVAMISRTSNTAVLETQPSTTGVAVALPPEERVRLTRSQIATIRTVLRDRSCRYERPAGFFIGSVVPTTAPVCAFPDRVVAAVPDIADYRFITRRNAVVVVDPADGRVVTVLR